jgi:hypothetical protein
MESPTGGSPGRRLYGQAQFLRCGGDEDDPPLGKRPSEFHLMIVNGLSVTLETGEHDWDVTSLKGTEDAADSGMADHQIGLLHQLDDAAEGQEVVRRGAERRGDWSVLDG